MRAFAKKLDSPVCDTLMGKGAYDGYDPLYTGMIGMHGTKTSNLGVSECDLLVALGARFSDRVIGNASLFAKNAKILHIDIDAAEINKNIHADVSIVGDLKDILTKLIARMEQMHHPEWTAHILELKEKYPLKYDDSQLSCPYIIEELDRITKGNAIITTDVGQHQMWAAQYYHYTKPRTFLSSGGLGTMGYGIGACIGAKTGCPDKICVQYRRRRMLPYEPDRACDSQQISDSDHPDHHQQSCSGHGAPVADALLWKTLFPDGSGGCSGLLQGSRRIGMRGNPRHREGGGCSGN